MFALRPSVHLHQFQESMSRSFYACLLLPLIIPTVIFSGCALAAGLSPAETGAAVLDQFAAKRLNLVVSGLPGFFPILLLVGVLAAYRRYGKSQRTRALMGWGGLLAILTVLVWVNLQFWPLFFPGRTSPGFPHGLEFIIGPVFFAPVFMALTMGGIWLAVRMNRGTTGEHQGSLDE